MPFKSMIASIGTGLVNNALSQSNASSQREWQEKMWHMQNSYNHPAAIADRMRSAGLNPYMMQGAEPAGSVGTGAPAQTIPLDNPLAYAKTFAEIDNLTASTSKTQTETDKLLKDMSMLDLMYSRGLLEKEEYEFNMRKYYEAWKEKNPYSLEAENKEVDTALKNAQKNTEESKKANIDALTLPTVAEIQQRIAESQQNIQESKKLIEESNARIQGLNIDSDIKKLSYELSQKFDEKFLLLDYAERETAVQEFLDTSEVRVSLYNVQKAFAKLAVDEATRQDALAKLTNEYDKHVAQQILDSAKDGFTSLDAALLKYFIADPGSSLSALSSILSSASPRITHKHYR